MNALVHQSTAAVHFPGTPPGGGSVIFFRPVVGHIQGAEGKLTQLAVGEGFADPADGIGQPQLGHHIHHHTGLPGGPDDALRILYRSGQGLFDQHMLALFDGGQCLGGVQAAGGADAHRIDLIACQKGLQCVKGSHAVCFCKAPGAFR